MKEEIIKKLEAYFGFSEHHNMELNNQSDSEGELKEDTSLMNDFLDALNVYGQNDLKSKMDDWEKAFKEHEGGQAPSDSDMFEASKSIIANSFKPNPQYETLINSRMRGNTILISNPQNGFDWNTQEFTFQISTTSDVSKLKYIIEDNQFLKIVANETNISDNLITITFDYKKQIPGKYYLKLLTDDAFTLISFFINKSSVH